MKKIVLIPDSFKGTMTSDEICDSMRERILVHYPQAQVIPIPVADGGEGSVDAFLSAMGGEKVYVPAKGPYLETMDAFYGLVDQGRTAIIEMAACAGLPLVGENRQAHKTSTFGVGELIAHALRRGCKKIIVGLGGSATNDLGVGAACALGVRFLDSSGRPFLPVGETLSDIVRIDLDELDPALSQVEIVTMCDIDNPLCGPEGASLVFGPQKGATPEMAEFLDRQLLCAARIIQRDIGVDVLDLPGGGAAGGMGAGMVAFFGSRLEMGIETVLNTVGFEQVIESADLILTGEGKIDGQSLRGKVVIGVARRAAAKEVPVVAVVGDIGDDAQNAYQEGVSAIFSINRVAVDFSKAKSRAKSDLALTVDNLLRFCRRMGL